MSAQALDWLVGRAADTTFDYYAVPACRPLMRACDGTNAASLAQSTPSPRTTGSLWMPTVDELTAATADLTE